MDNELKKIKMSNLLVQLSFLLSSPDHFELTIPILNQFVNIKY